MSLRRAFALPLALALLAGCANHPAVPVVDRGQVAVVDKASGAQTVPVQEAPPGYYVVKKGDTLLRISLDNGQDYRDVAAWNKLEDPNKINVGQVLRIVPTDGVAISRPVVFPPSPVATEKTGVDGSPPASDDLLKREPKGGSQNYSDEALARMRQTDAGGAAKGVEKPLADKQPTEKPAPPSNAGEGPDWAWPGSGKVLASFSEASNKGIDIAGKPGDPVQAAAAGKVVYAGAGLRGYGNLVIIKHDSTYLSAYAHNSKILVKEGQSVAKGMKIAEVGSSDAEQPKLHFEIRKQGKPVDPIAFLPRR